MGNKIEPKLWRDMTDAEKGELLLAHHEGKAIEVFEVSIGDWVKSLDTISYGWNACRIKPELAAPKRKTVTLYGYYDDRFFEWLFDETKTGEETHSITFNTIDGKPDCASIKMEPVE